MKAIIKSLLLIGCLLVGVNTAAQMNPKRLYTYDFGGLEKMEAGSVVEMLTALNYAGIVVGGRGTTKLKRLDTYLALSEKHGKDFEVFAVYMSHSFDKYGFSDKDHRIAIDRIAGKGIDLWIWGKDKNQDGSVTDDKVEDWISGIVEYAASKDVKVVLYSHYGTYFQTTDDVLQMAEKINNPNLGVTVNLSHELRSEKGSFLKQTFKKSKKYISAIILSGSNIELDKTSNGTRNSSTVKSLENSEYDLVPFVKLSKKYGGSLPIGFINFKLSEDPNIYLKNTMDKWIELCNEVGFYEK